MRKGRRKGRRRGIGVISGIAGRRVVVFFFGGKVGEDIRGIVFLSRRNDWRREGGLTELEKKEKEKETKEK